MSRKQIALFEAWLVFCFRFLGRVEPFHHAPASQRCPRNIRMPTVLRQENVDHQDKDAPGPYGVGLFLSLGERQTRRSLIGSTAAVGAMLLSSSSRPCAVAADTGTSSFAASLSKDRVASLLKPIPTFTIVDATGVPFMVVGEDAKVTAYFFTEFTEADRILKLAKASANKAIAESKNDPATQGEDLINPWNQARISTVPLDTAVKLFTKSVASKGGGNYFKLSPSVADVEQALAITGDDDLAEGKVPLFYYPDFSLEKADGSKESPLYFRKSQLEAAFKNARKGDPIPEKASVTELFAVLQEFSKQPDDTIDPELDELTLVAPKESAKKAKECQRKGGSQSPFVLGQRIVVL